MSLKESTSWYFAAGGLPARENRIHPGECTNISHLLLLLKSSISVQDCCTHSRGKLRDVAGEKVEERCLVLLGRQVVCGVGTAVDVAIGLKAVLGCSHHVWGLYWGSANRWVVTEFKLLCKMLWISELATQKNKRMMWAWRPSLCCNI